MKLKFLGATTQSSSGAGSLSINTLTNLYTSSLPSLQTYHISHSVLRIGVSADLSGTLFQIDAGSGIVVQDAVNPTVGSVTGDGNLQFGETASTGLTIATPQGRTDLFSGTILGVGGTLTKSSAGQLTIGDLNAGGVGAFSVNVQSGTLLGTGVIKAQRVNVGRRCVVRRYDVGDRGPGRSEWGRDLRRGAERNRDSSSTPASPARGPPAPSPWTAPPWQSVWGTPRRWVTPLQSCRRRTGSRDSSATPSTARPSWPGLPPSASITRDGGHPDGTALTTTQIASSVNPSPLDQSVSFTATILSGGSPVTVGTVTFLLGSTPLGNPVAVGSDGKAGLVTSGLPVGAHTITAQYSGSGSFASLDEPDSDRQPARHDHCTGKFP